MTAGCPDEAALERFVRDRSSAPDVGNHVVGCETCSAAVREIEANNAILAEGALLRRHNDTASGLDLPDIDGYEMQGEIHRGGQGIVYRARQLAANRTVAIKTLTSGAFSTARQRRRFEREVEFVANLRHPNIVTVYDSGRTADGGYYLAMQYVDGRPLVTTSLDPGTIDRAAIEQRLRVFEGICDAVSAAHRRGIIHRDLKPANILIDTEGVPHVVDFGIARRADPDARDDELSRTVPGEFVGTFAYAAPEQVGGSPADVDIRTDVYALGVLLYELLTGARPYPLAGGIADVVRAIETAEIIPPSKRNPAVDTELDAIVMMALRREPDRRYESAMALRAELERYRRGEPINARRDQRGYMLRKTLQRYRVAVTIAAAFMVLVTAFGAGMFGLYRKEQAQKQRVQATFEPFLGLLRSENLHYKAGEDTIPGLLREAGGFITDHLDDEPDLAEDLRRQLGLAGLTRSDYAFSLEQFELIRISLERRRPDDDAAMGQALHDCGRALWFLGRFDEAEQRYRSALERRLRRYGAQHDDVAQTRSHLAATLRKRRQFAEAEILYRESLAVRRAMHEPPHASIAAGLNNLGRCLRDQERFADALALHREALAMVRALPEARPEWTAQGEHNVAACLLGLDRAEEAATALQRALDWKRGAFDPWHPSLARSELLHAELMLARGDRDGAAAHATALLVTVEAHDPDSELLEDIERLRERCRSGV